MNTTAYWLPVLPTATTGTGGVRVSWDWWLRTNNESFQYCIFEWKLWILHYCIFRSKHWILQKPWILNGYLESISTCWIFTKEESTSKIHFAISYQKSTTHLFKSEFIPRIAFTNWIFILNQGAKFRSRFPCLKSKRRMVQPPMVKVYWQRSRVDRSNLSRESNLRCDFVDERYLFFIRHAITSSHKTILLI